MNIKKIVSGAVVAVTVLSMATPALALDLSKAKLQWSDNINWDCMSIEGYDPVWGCFINNYVVWPGHPDLRPEPTIYIRKGLPAGLFSYVYLYNLSQYVTLNYTDAELAQVFNPITTGNRNLDLRKDAANSFVYWAMGGKLTPAKENFFREALAK